MITVTPKGDYFKVEIKVGDNKYGFKSDDGSLKVAIEALCDIITKKELGFDRHDILMAIGQTIQNR